MIFIIILCQTLVSGYTFSQQPVRTASAYRAEASVKVDGILDELSWQQSEVLSGFRQYEPVFDADASFPTEVRIMFDDVYLYVGAKMYDKSPDSLLMQLGNRDDELNADAFGIKFDTYNKQNDAYVFEVTSSGVQKDYRDNDSRFDAVWHSAVKVNADSWVVEMAIPYAAIRFPAIDSQVWRLQMYRNLRRKREWSQWALENKTSTNKKVYWGELHGINQIKPPVRLSLSPYLTAHGEHYPYNIENIDNLSGRFSGGIDLKLGLGESHTLDVTLLPDFSQVQSDVHIKNLSAFETVYDENRPFFRESVDLFNKGNLFYSRRIGRIPINYNKARNNLAPNEFIIQNPYQAGLINAVKFSGRDKRGLAIGVFNALTGNTYAVIGDISGSERQELTDPMTNYNIIVADKAFNKGSSVYLINTNVLRDSKFNNANVSGAGINLYNKSNMYVVNVSGARSYIFDKTNAPTTGGNYYYLNAGKVKGSFLFSVYRSLTDDTFNKNDFGLQHVNNDVTNGLTLNYNILEPFGYFYNLRNRLSIKYNYHFLTQKPTTTLLELFSFGTTRDYLSVWASLYSGLVNAYDYYEPRQIGRYYLAPIFRGGSFNFSSDYRKTLALDGGVELSHSNTFNALNQTYSLQPILRLNNHLSFNHSASLTLNRNDIGYAGTDTASNIFFGRRKVQTIENTFSSLYVIKNDLSISLRARYYWVIGDYDSYYLLNTNGTLSNDNTFSSENDFNFNSLNIDMVFNWQFAPGSHLSLIWKNALLEENNTLIYNFADNFSNTLAYPQLNTLTLKLLLYLDYNTFKQKRASFFQ